MGCRQNLVFGCSLFTTFSRSLSSAHHRQSDHCSLWCIRRPTDKQREAQQSMQPNSQKSWEMASLVIGYIVIFINLQTTSASLVFISLQFWQKKSWTCLRRVECQIHQSSGQTLTLSRDKSTRRHGAHTTEQQDSKPTSGWQSKLCLRVTKALLLVLLVVRRYDLDTDGPNIAMSLERSVM